MTSPSPTPGPGPTPAAAGPARSPWPLAGAAGVATAAAMAVAGLVHRALAGAVGSPWVALGIALAVVVALVALAGRGADRAVALAAVGAVVALVGSGLGRLGADETFEGRGGGDVVRESARSWPVLAVGVGLVLGAVVVGCTRGDRRPRSVAALAGLATHTVASLLVAVLMGRVVVGQWIEGRPRRRRGRLVRPGAGDGEGGEGAPTVADLWADAAREEAEAVDAFGDLAVRLEAVGAPPDLVRRSRRAAGEEVRHARLCHRLAGPGAVPTGAGAGPRDRKGRAAARPRVASRRVELVRLAVESYVDGVVGEGMAAGRLERGAATAPDRAAVLGSIARDERAHAALGADVVRWAAAEAPRLVPPAVRAAARHLPVAPRLPARHAAVPGPDLRAAGLVDRAGAAAVWSAERTAALALLDDLPARRP